MPDNVRSSMTERRERARAPRGGGRGELQGRWSSAPEGPLNLSGIYFAAILASHQLSAGRLVHSSKSRQGRPPLGSGLVAGEDEEGVFDVQLEVLHRHVLSITAPAFRPILYGLAHGLLALSPPASIPVELRLGGGQQRLAFAGALRGERLVAADDRDARRDSRARLSPPYRGRMVS